MAFYTAADVLTIGTNFYGSFGLYALEKVDGLSASDALVASLVAVPVIVVTVLAIMRAMDTRARGPLFYIGAVLQMLVWLMFLVVPVDAMTLIIAFVVYGFANTLAGEPHYKVWSQESFPTRLRSSAVGVSFGIARITSAIFLVFVPTLLLSGFTTLVVLMVAVTALSGVLGAVFRPRGQGESVEDIDARLTSP
jgi:inositol transporter-like SP family MFS transporter